MITQQEQDWPEIGEILVNHGAQAPEPVTELDGRRFELIVGDEPVELAFDADTLTWLAADNAMNWPCTVWKAREDVYFIRVDQSRQERLLILALAPARLLEIAITAPIPDAPEGLAARLAAYGSQSAVAISYRQGGPASGSDTPFPSSTQLIGQQFRYRYSDTHLYDHFYLSERYYAWFCRQGPDGGLGDIEECDHFAIADDLVLVCWREKLLPCVGITLEDHCAMRTLGMIFGADSATGETQGAIVSATITHIAEIDASAS